MSRRWSLSWPRPKTSWHERRRAETAPRRCHCYAHAPAPARAPHTLTAHAPHTRTAHALQDKGSCATKEAAQQTKEPVDACQPPPLSSSRFPASRAAVLSCLAALPLDGFHPQTLMRARLLSCQARLSLLLLQLFALVGPSTTAMRCHRRARFSIITPRVAPARLVHRRSAACRPPPRRLTVRSTAMAVCVCVMRARARCHASRL